MFVGLALVLLIPFWFWGDDFAARFSREGTREWLQGFGSWAWAAALLLLVLDIVLPVPATALMAALGYAYGTLLGGAIGAAGSFLSGTVAYLACRSFGRRMAERIVGAKDLQRGEKFFERSGGWAVALSRWLPLLPEVISCMAGLTRMPARHFFVALACGALPMAYAFAAVGALGAGSPTLSLTLSAVLPCVLWPIARQLLRGDDAS
jgi:uncharacterized membrane protein YdjX (TVP38/TMEM64 family)